MTPIADEEIKRILVVMAHPDDCDFGAGGSIAKWREAGIEVSYCIITNGDQGGEESDVPVEEMAKVRQREQRAAGAALGVSEITFLNYRDGSLIPTIELRRDIVKAIRIAKPDRMVVQSPERNWERITETIDKKIAALKAHVSQTAHNPELESMVRQWGERNAEANGLAAGRVAEIFKVVSTD